VIADDPDDRKGRLKNIGGSQSGSLEQHPRQSGRADATSREPTPIAGTRLGAADRQCPAVKSC
jgi:hypothetical protein